MIETNLLFTAGLLLVVLAAGGALALRVGQSVIPAYILAGILLGPHAPTVGGVSLTVLDDPETVQLLADLGVVTLLFFVGLELGIDQLLRERGQFLRAGAADVGISLPLGFGVGLAFGFGWLEAAFLALIVFNSSTVIVAKSLLDLGWIGNPETGTILGVVVIEDVLTALAFAVLSAVLLGSGGVAGLAVSTGVAVGFLVALVTVAYYGTGALERAFGTESAELFLLAVLGAAALVAGAGAIAGVSEAVAAFLVGTAFGRTRYADRVQQLVAPSRDLFAAIFFFSVGLATDPALLVATADLVAVAAVVTVGGQVASGHLAGRAYGLTPRRALRVGCALTPRGEFSLVIAAFLAAAGTTTTLAETIPAFTVGYVLVTSVLGTVLMRNCGRFERALGLSSTRSG